MQLRRMGRLIGFVLLCLCFLAGAVLAQVGLCAATEGTRLRVCARLTQAWARALLALLGLQVGLSEHGETAPGKACLLVANHQSYLDILICAAYFPTLFVAKQELRRWPLLGWLAALGGTLFIDRASTHNAVQGVFLREPDVTHGRKRAGLS